MSAHPPATLSISATPGTQLSALADQCVMCGLCLPHCPTYRLDAIEAESPRGRIALARALATGALQPGPRALMHLDHCLGCLSCQKVCPSQVQYESILVQTRALLADRRPAPTRLQRWLRNPQRLTRLARIGAALRAGRWMPALVRWLPQGSTVRRLAATQPDLPRTIDLPVATNASATHGRVALFRGCVASVYDRDTLSAARHLLEALGHEVVELPGTWCCGALPRHQGDTGGADAQAAATRGALKNSGADVVLSCASGCHGDLRDHVATGTLVRVVDSLAFIATDPGFAALRFRPLAARAALHLPCTQVNVVGGAKAIGAMLARIPELTVLVLPEQPRCCGAAGNYFIEQPDFADRLRDEKLDQIGTLAPDLVLTTNIGCRIHLGNGLGQRAADIPVCHPLALLAQQLETTAP